MEKTITLSIPNPCQEKWDNFTQIAHGGFCGSCKKEVVDFTKMSDEQLLQYFSKKQEHTCGRFNANQLKSLTMMNSPSINPGFTLMRAGVLGLFMLMVSTPSFAQVEPKSSIEIVPTNKTVSTSLTDYIIKGTVSSTEDGEVLPGVNIFLKNNSMVGTVSDADGKFEFPKKLKTGEVIVFSFIGLQTQEYTIPEQSAGDVDIKLEVDMIADCMIMMGEVSVDAVYTEPKLLQRVWNKVKSVF